MAEEVLPLGRGEPSSCFGVQASYGLHANHREQGVCPLEVEEWVEEAVVWALAVCIKVMGSELRRVDG